MEFDPRDVKEALFEFLFPKRPPSTLDSPVFPKPPESAGWLFPKAGAFAMVVPEAGNDDPKLGVWVLLSLFRLKEKPGLLLSPLSAAPSENAEPAFAPPFPNAKVDVPLFEASWVLFPPPVAFDPNNGVLAAFPAAPELPAAPNVKVGLPALAFPACLFGVNKLTSFMIKLVKLHLADSKP